MQAFTRLTAIAAPLPLANVDTDMIIAAPYMKSLTKSGLGQHLFQSIRYYPDGSERADFILNTPACRNAKILITDRNFGCGSSREHAVWALTDFGICCIIAPSFGDIFASNARKNGLLLIGLDDDLCKSLQHTAALAPLAPMTTDLEQQSITTASGDILPFAIDPDDRHILIHGLDDITRTLRHAQAISAYEART